MIFKIQKFKIDSKLKIQNSELTNKGFTLIEILLYLAIVSVVLVVGTIFIWQVIEGGERANQLEELREASRFVLEKISQEVKKARNVLDPPSCQKFTNQTDCQSYWACLWQNNKCFVTCTRYNNQPDCENHNCIWSNGVCSGSEPKNLCPVDPENNKETCLTIAKPDGTMVKFYRQTYTNVKRIVQKTGNNEPVGLTSGLVDITSLKIANLSPDKGSGIIRIEMTLKHKNNPRLTFTAQSSISLRDN
ncbi:MAG: prepilin-type N-terminal cleavage/methylation domain-containing protein [Patescibacteria group bacterium]|nr:prepilin-type N-terminal cleavage/methylation domain-containing protein [Patescibacteria group bacterium]